MRIRCTSFSLQIVMLSILLTGSLRAQYAGGATHSPLDYNTLMSEELSREETVSFKNVPEDLALNFSGLFSRENLRTLVMGISLAGLGSAFDENEFDDPDDLLGHRQEPEEGSVPGRVGEVMGHHILVPSVIAGLTVTGQFAGDRRFRLFSYSLVQGYIVNNALTTGLKYAVGRTRPNGLNDLSFPSGHTSNAFMWATVASHYYGIKAAIPSYAAASFIAWSRLDMDAHYLSDVLFGAFIGYISGKTVVRTTDEHNSGETFSWTATVSDGRYGVVTSYRW